MSVRNLAIEAPSGSYARRNEDTALVERVQAGDRAAFRALYDRWFARVTAQVARTVGARANDVEDIVQDVFVQLYRSIGSFGFESQFSTWLYRLTFNVTISSWRRRRGPELVDLDTYRQLASDEDAWSRVQSRDRLRLVLSILEGIPVEAREVFLLNQIDGVTIAEISAMTGAPVGTVAARIARARETIRTAVARTELVGTERS